MSTAQQKDFVVNIVTFIRPPPLAVPPLQSYDCADDATAVAIIVIPAVSSPSLCTFILKDSYAISKQLASS
jgi:hypothetical protein